MSNKSEFLPLVIKLLAKTKDRKIDWKGTYDSLTFICALEGEYSFEIEKGTASGSSLRILTMRDREQGEVFVLRATSPTPSSPPENDAIFQVLEELFENARRVALDIDKKVSEATNILDKI